MTALKNYLCLEAIGILRDRPDEAPIEVIVSLGKSTLLLKDTRERPLGHWALAGVVRLGRDGDAVIYSMTAEGGETLTIRDKDMVEAIATLSRPELGQAAPVSRLRSTRRHSWPIVPILLAVLTGVAVLGLPKLLLANADEVMPPEAAAAVGDRILTDLIEKQGPPCNSPSGRAALGRIIARVEPAATPPTYVLDLGVPAALLPGGSLLVDRNLTRTAQAEEIAGWSLVALERDPVRRLLAGAGTIADIGFLLTGSFPEDALDRATHLLLTPPDADEIARAAAGLKAVEIDPAPFLAAAAATPVAHTVQAPAAPLLDPADRRALRAICG